MPKQKRWSVKRSLNQSVLAIEKSQNYLVTVGHEYEVSHPDYYEAFKAVVTSLELVKTAIETINGQI